MFIIHNYLLITFYCVFILPIVTHTTGQQEVLQGYFALKFNCFVRYNRREM